MKAFLKANTFQAALKGPIFDLSGQPKGYFRQEVKLIIVSDTSSVSSCLFTKNAQGLVSLNAAEIKQQEIQFLCPWGQDSFQLALSPKDLSLSFSQNYIHDVCSHCVLKCFSLNFSTFSLVSLRDRSIHFYQAVSPQRAHLRKTL